MKITIEHTLTAAELAESFCALTDEAQAQFFIEAARIAATWPQGTGPQWLNVGRHLRDCPCSTLEAIDLVREIADATQAPECVAPEISAAARAPRQP